MTHPERDQEFFSRLEEVLDEQFPKIEEEGPEKKANRRGAALILFVEANRIHNEQRRKTSWAVSSLWGFIFGFILWLFVIL